MDMQQPMQTYLFVCLANMNRSPAAATVFQGLARARGVKVRVVSAGISPLARKPVDTKTAEEADLIFVMEDYMKHDLVGDFDVHPGKVVVLGIPDIYDRDDPMLVKQLRDALLPYVGQE
jgi:predicted protein tyrosine phosphatase